MASLALVVACSQPPSLSGTEEIPGDRLTDWTYAGIPGGIPERQSIHRTLRPGASARDINAAIAAASGTGQVVFLEAGIYRLDEPVDIGAATDVTLRGAGAGRTVLEFSAPGRFSVVSEPTRYFDPAIRGGEDVVSGLTRGSTRITLASAAPRTFRPGALVQIVQDDDGRLVFRRKGNWAGARNLRHTSRIIEVKGRDVVFATPIPYSFEASRRPQANAMAVNARLVGVEDLTIDARGKLGLTFGGADRCWIRRVETRGTGNSAIEFRGSSQCEVRRCFLHDAQGYPRQGDGYGVFLFYGSGYCRVEDNIGSRLANLVLINGASGCAVLYNLDEEGGRAGLPWVMPSFNCNHGPHGIMNLFEGNVIARFQNDGYHGSASHMFLLRNRVHGLHPEHTFERQLVDLTRGSYYHSLVGNVLGDRSWKPDAYEMSGNPGHGDSCVYQLGYPNADNTSLVPETEFEGFRSVLPDPKVRETLLRIGNYDYFHRRVIGDGEATPRTLPPSLAYAAKPGYFGSLAWPAIGPDVDGLAGDIPAQVRWAAFTRSRDARDLFRDP